jgi:6-phosphogluconolactonase (cycloisomerase 2 family)
MSGEIKTTLWCLKTHKTSYDGQSLLLVMKNIIYLLWKRDKQYYYTANSPNRGATLFHHRRSYPAV